MVKIVNGMNQLKFSELMYVYSEANMDNGAERYPNLSVDAQIREAEVDFYNYLNDVFFQTDGAFYAILELNCRYVSALRMEPYRDGWLLCALETAPNERNRGHAFNLIRSSLDYLRTFNSKKVYSHVSKDGWASIATHMKCGFRIEKDHAVYLDGSVLHSCYTMVYHM